MVTDYRIQCWLRMIYAVFCWVLFLYYICNNWVVLKSLGFQKFGVPSVGKNSLWLYFLGCFICVIVSYVYIRVYQGQRSRSCLLFTVSWLEFRWLVELSKLRFELVCIKYDQCFQWVFAWRLLFFVRIPMTYWVEKAGIWIGLVPAEL